MAANQESHFTKITAKSVARKLIQIYKALIIKTLATILPGCNNSLHTIDSFAPLTCGPGEADTVCPEICGEKLDMKTEVVRSGWRGL